jgi:hypothetical protein
VGKKHIAFSAAFFAAGFIMGGSAGLAAGRGGVPHNPERAGKDFADIRELGSGVAAIGRDAGELRERLAGDKELVDQFLSGADGLGAIPGSLDRAGGELGGIGDQLRTDSAELRKIYFDVLSRPVQNGEVP